MAHRGAAGHRADHAHRQAELAEQSVDIVRAHYPYAEMLVWFLVRDVSPTSYWRSGLVDSANHKKPVFAVWQRLASAGNGETLPSRSMLALWIAIAVVVLVLLWLVFGYNRLVRLRNEAEQGFSGIDVQLKRRADLIPNLVETVKAYARTRAACSRPSPRPARRPSRRARRRPGRHGRGRDDARR